MWGPNQRILLTEDMDHIESLAYNWVTKQLFWVDSGHKRLETLSLKNGKRIVVLNNLEEPKSLAIHPKMGYACQFVCLSVCLFVCLLLFF